MFNVIFPVVTVATLSQYVVQKIPIESRNASEKLERKYIALALKVLPTKIGACIYDLFLSVIFFGP